MCAVRLVIDASTLVGELLRERGKKLILDPRLELFIAEPTWSEMRHELLRRQKLLVNRGGLSPELAATLLQEGFDVAERALSTVSNASLEPFRADALGRIPQDPDDWPSVALALMLSVGIWTEDRDFFGSGLATWQTSVLRHVLVAERIDE